MDRPLSLRAVLILCALFPITTGAAMAQTDAAASAKEDAAVEQPPLPDFWKGRVEDITQVVGEVRRGEVSVIARSPGGRDVYLVAYGEPDDLHSQANYNSACGGRDPSAYARKTEGMKPVIFIIGPAHGQEMENTVGLLNLIRVAETGKDWRGRDWSRLAANVGKCRLLIIPSANPDGRARCPYDAWVGVERELMTKFGQGTRGDGSLYGWPGCKLVHPMVDDVGILGAYYNDAGINPMHDEFFAPMADETRAIMEIARTEAPDFAVSLHSHGNAPQVLEPRYVPVFIKEHVQQFGERLMERYQDADLPAGRVPAISEDGDQFPPPTFNLISALHHVSGTASFTFECAHGVTGDDRYAKVSFEDILDIQLMLYDELLQYALDNPVHWVREDTP